MTKEAASIVWYHLTAPQIIKALRERERAEDEDTEAEVIEPEDARILPKNLPEVLRESYGAMDFLWPAERHISLMRAHELPVLRLPPLFVGPSFSPKTNRQGGEKLQCFLLAAGGKTPCWYAGIRQSDLAADDPTVWLAKAAEIEKPWLKLTNTTNFLKLVLMAEIAESQRYPHDFYGDGNAFLKSLGVEPAVLFDPRKAALGYGNFWDAESGQVCFAALNEAGGCSVLAVRPQYAAPKMGNAWPMSYMASCLDRNVKVIERRPPPPFDWPSIIKRVNPAFTPLDFILPAGEQPAFEQPGLDGETQPKPLREYSAVGKGLHSADFLLSIPGRERLRSLAMRGNYISDLTPFAGLDNLRFLSLNGNPISDLTPIAGLTRLNTLMLNGTLIGNDALPLIKGLKKLGSLEIADTKVTDLTGLAGYKGWGLEIWGLPGLQGAETLGTMKKLSTIYVDTSLAEGCDIPSLLPQMAYRAEKNGIVQFASASYFDE
ncbi:MAG: leucine-rich repeat domain-containing protein [Oscillospiraceae bacterium]|nr:leucine-rich repeat domain-containing protein [Oscillospiraceae bacterium]